MLQLLLSVSLEVVHGLDAIERVVSHFVLGEMVGVLIDGVFLSIDLVDLKLPPCTVSPHDSSCVDEVSLMVAVLLVRWIGRIGFDWVVGTHG